MSYGPKAVNFTALVDVSSLVNKPAPDAGAGAWVSGGVFQLEVRGSEFPTRARRATSKQRVALTRCLRLLAPLPAMA